ncbi:hypothetical protein HK096_000419, partial [Nowakowskiella sp. JEL0078]
MNSRASSPRHCMISGSCGSAGLSRRTSSNNIGGMSRKTSICNIGILSRKPSIISVDEKVNLNTFDSNASFIGMIQSPMELNGSQSSENNGNDCNKASGGWSARPIVIHEKKLVRPVVDIWGKAPSRFPKNTKSSLGPGDYELQKEWKSLDIGSVVFKSKLDRFPKQNGTTQYFIAPG